MTATLWNVSDQTSGITLTNGSLIATVTTSHTREGVRATTSKNSASGGKWMVGFRNVQFQTANNPDTFDWVGLILANTVDITLTRANGSFKQIVLMQFGHAFNGDSTTADAGSHNEFSDFSALTAACDIDLAVDFDNKKFWFRVSNQSSNQWNASGTANPATNTGGHTILADGVFFPSIRLSDSTAFGTLEPVPSGLPSGFNTWGTPQLGMFLYELPDHFVAAGYAGSPGGSGFLAATGTPDTFAAVGFQPITGTLRATEAPDQFSAYMVQPIRGTFVVTEAPDRFVATGLGRGENGIFVTTEAPDVFHATGNVPILGTFVTTENPDTFSAIGAGVTVVRKRRIFSVS